MFRSAAASLLVFLLIPSALALGLEQPPAPPSVEEPAEGTEADAAPPPAEADPERQPDEADAADEGHEGEPAQEAAAEAPDPELPEEESAAADEPAGEADPEADDPPPARDPTVGREAVVAGRAPSDEEAVAEEGGPEEPEEARRKGFLPRLDVFFPEGELDLRVSRLVRQVLFEGQLNYNFLEGDITAFLRYRYYGYKRTYQLSVFDALEFDDLEELSDEFSRVRGILGLVSWPHDFHRRTFLLLELDRLISNKEELRFSNNQTNTFVRVGYQRATPRDDRSARLVGERRARIERVFTPFRQIGPGDIGFTAAATYGFDVGFGDFDYVQLEAEALRRFKLPGRKSLVGRARAGTFPHVEQVRELDDELGVTEADLFSVPRQELFRLDGRENLKGLGERLRGTEEIQTTWELFWPWFLEQERKTGPFVWNNWYWVLYAGVGNIGFDSSVFTELGDYLPDVGFGFESSFQIKKYSFFLSGIVAQNLQASGGIEANLSVKSYH